MINKNKKVDFTIYFELKPLYLRVTGIERFTSFSVLEQYMHLAVQLNNIQICYLHYKDIKGVEDFYL